VRIPTYDQFQRNASMISKGFDQMSRLEYQVSTGKKLMDSSDDPSLAFQIKSHEDYLNLLQSYGDNVHVAQNRASLLETSMQGLTSLGGDVEILLKKAQNGTLGDADRKALAEQLQGKLNNLFHLANTQDADGQYVYSGINATVPAYQQVNGSYQYQGSSSPLMINVSPNMDMLYGEAGNKIFDRIYSGNGTFSITAPSSNQGSAFLSPGTVNTANYVSDQYSIQFVTNSNGELAYQVTGVNTGQIIPAPPATTPQNAPVVTSGMGISFNGVSLTVQGQPVAGDSFQIQPSTSHNVFDLLQGAINVLKTPVTNQGNYNQLMSQTSAAFSQVLNQFTQRQAEIGTQAATIYDLQDSSKVNINNEEIALGKLENADMNAAVSALAQQSLILQATQESYMKMQDVLEKMMQLRS